MNNTERDTHFAGFAEALFEDIKSMFNNHYIEIDNGELQEAEETKQDILECFAQCAYDLVKHVLDTTEHINLDRLSTEEHIRTIPDLPIFPTNKTE